MIFPLCIGDFLFSFIVGAEMSIWQSTTWSCIVIAGSAQKVRLYNRLDGGQYLILKSLKISVRDVTTTATSLTCFIFRFLRRSPSMQTNNTYPT